MNRVEIDTKKLRDELETRYIVQCVTATNRYGNLVLMGYCLRDRSTSCWDTVFEHKDRVVCQKIADMLNEEELTKC